MKRLVDGIKHHRRTLFFLLVPVLALIIAVFWRGTAVKAPQAEYDFTPPYAENAEVDLTGELVCLQHRGNPEVTTMECAIGFKDLSGRFFFADSTVGEIGTLPFGERLQVHGQYNTNDDERYMQSGTITITTVIQNSGD